jgi:hypothetical protein
MSASDGERGPSKPEEFVALCTQMHDLLKEMRRGVERDWERAQDALANLARMQTAQGLAPAFFERRRPWEGNAELTAMVENGLLDHAAFPQKMPHILAFYRRLLTTLDREPASILEIGVKGGGSVIEDTHSSVRKPGSTRSTEHFGTDIWPDFMLAVFERLRRGPVPRRRRAWSWRQPCRA